MESTWFNERINSIQEQSKKYKVKQSFDYQEKLGDKIKQIILQKYDQNRVYL